MHYNFFLAIIGERSVAQASMLIKEGAPWICPAPPVEFEPSHDALRNASLAAFLGSPDQAVHPPPWRRRAHSLGARLRGLAGRGGCDGKGAGGLVRPRAVPHVPCS